MARRSCRAKCFQVRGRPRRFPSRLSFRPQRMRRPRKPERAPDYNGLDSFTYAANDGVLHSDNLTVNLTVAPVNDAPVLVLNAGAASATERYPIAVAPALTLADVDSTTLAKAAVQITGNY